MAAGLSTGSLFLFFMPDAFVSRSEVQPGKKSLPSSNCFRGPGPHSPNRAKYHGAKVSAFFMRNPQLVMHDRVKSNQEAAKEISHGCPKLQSVHCCFLCCTPASEPKSAYLQSGGLPLPCSRSRRRNRSVDERGVTQFPAGRRAARAIHLLPEIRQAKLYSVRKASTGSIEAALRAGISPATQAATASVTTALASTPAFTFVISYN